MTEEKDNDLQTVALHPGKSDNFSISLDTAHDGRLEQIKTEREDYVSKSKIIEWALDEYLQKKGYKVVNDRRERDGEADIILPEFFEKGVSSKAEEIKSGETRVFPIRLQTTQDYFLDHIQKSQEDFISKSKIIEWALDEYFLK